MSGNQQALLMASEGGFAPPACVADPHYSCGPASTVGPATVFSPSFMGAQFSWQEENRLLLIYNATSAVSNAALARYSNDGGFTWLNGTIPSGQYYRIVKGATRFVAGTGYGAVAIGTAVSTDGITWTAGANMPASDYWYAFGSNGTTIVALRWLSTTVARSTNDAASWSTHSSGSALQWYGVVYSTGDSRWLAVAGNSATTRVSLDDGVTWSAGPSLVGIAGADNVVYGGDRMVATNSLAPTTSVSVLIDGAGAWVNSPLPVSSSVTVRGAIWDGEVWTISIGTNVLFVSTDALNWSIVYLKNNSAARRYVLGNTHIFHWFSLGETQQLTLSAANVQRTVLAVHADSLSAGTAVLDDSSFTAPATVAGTISTSTEQAVFGQSMRFNGLTTELVSFPASSAYAFSGSDFTIECWFFLAADSPSISGARDATLLSTWPAVTGWSLRIQGSASTTGTGIFFEVKNAGATNNVTVVNAIAKNQWHHIAVCRASGTLRIFLNGFSVYSAAYATGFSSGGQPLFIGRNSPSGAGFEWPINGYLDEVRVSNGVGRYTSDFAVPTEPFSSSDPFFAQVALLVHFDFANLSEDSCYRTKTVSLTGAARVQGSVVKFGSGAVAVPNVGTSTVSGIEVVDSTDFDFGTSDFAISFWAYRTANTYLGYLCYISTPSVATFLTVGTDGNLDAQLRSSGGTQTSTDIIAFPLNQWVFVSLQRIGTNWVVGLNDSTVLTLAITGGSTSTVNSTNNWYFGRPNTSSAQTLNGHIDEIRVWRNVATVGSPPTAGFLPYCDATSSYVTSGTERLVGQQIATAQGTLRVADPSVRLSGEVLTAAAGTVTPVQPNREAALTGAQAQVQQASVAVFTPDRISALTGQALAAARGTVSVAPYPDLVAVTVLLPDTDPSGSIGIYPDGRVTVIVSSTPEYEVGNWIAPSPYYSISSIAHQYQVRAATVFSGAVTNPTPIPYNLSTPAYFSYAFGASFTLFIQPTLTNPRYGEAGYYGTIFASSA